MEGDTGLTPGISAHELGLWLVVGNVVAGDGPTAHACDVYYVLVHSKYRVEPVRSVGQPTTDNLPDSGVFVSWKTCTVLCSVRSTGY